MLEVLEAPKRGESRPHIRVLAILFLFLFLFLFLSGIGAFDLWLSRPQPGGWISLDFRRGVAVLCSVCGSRLRSRREGKPARRGAWGMHGMSALVRLPLTALAVGGLAVT